MLRWTLLRMMLLLWMTRVTLQGGTGYSLGPNSKSANIKGNGYGNPSAVSPGNNGQSASLPAANGNGATFKGYGASAAAMQKGFGAKPNGQSASLPVANGNGATFKGYGASAAAMQNGFGAKPNGYGNPSAVAPGNNGQSASLPAANGNGATFKGYGASAAATQNGYGAKPNAPVAPNAYGGKPMNYGAVSAKANGQGAKPNGAYGSKQNLAGYGGSPSYGGIGMGMGMMNHQAANKKGGAGTGYGATKGQNLKSGGYGVPAGYPNGQAAKGPKPGYGVPAGYPNGQPAKGPKPGYGGAVKGPNAGSSLGSMGYPNSGVKGPKPGYGAKAGHSNGQGANPNGYGGAVKGPNAGSSLGSMGYPNSGVKGPKPGYGAKAGYSNGQGANPNGYGGAVKGPNAGSMGYPNSGVKGPKPGYGAKAGFSNGQGANPNGYGGAVKGPNAGSMGYPNSGVKGPKPGYGAKAGFSNGQGANPNGYGGAAKGPDAGSSQGSMGYPDSGIKGPKPGYGAKAGQSNVQGANSKGYGVPAGMFKGPYTKGINSGYSPVKNGKGGVSNTSKGPKGETLSSDVQGHLPVSANTKGVLPLAEHESSTRFPSDISSVLQQTKGPSLLLPQGKAPKPFPQVPQTVALSPEQEQSIGQVVPQPITSQSGISSMASLAQSPQSKASNPAPETQHISPAFQPNLLGLDKTNGQQQAANPEKPDCGPGGRANGQWIKLPSPGSMYPKQNGANPSQPAFGAGVSGYPVPGMSNGYKGYGAGHGSYPNGEYIKGYGNGQAGPNGAVKGKPAGAPTGLGSKGKSQTKYGIGGRAFGGFPNKYQSNPSGKYGNNGMQYGNKPYNAKAGGQYGFGGLPHNKQPLGYGGEKLSGRYGFGGLPNGGQSFGLKTEAKSDKYGNPAVPYELLGPVTDGQSVNENRNLEALHQGPEIDGQKSIDHFGEGEVPPQPDDHVTLAAGDLPPKSTDKYGNGDYTHERIQPEVVSFPAAPTEGPVPYIPAITSHDSAHPSVDSSLTPESSSLAYVPGPVESVGSDVVSEVSPLMLQPPSQQQIHIQQHLKFHIHPHGDAHTGGKEGKYGLNGFFGNKYQG